MRQSAPEEAYRKLDELAKKHIDVLRKITKQVGDAKHTRDDDALREALTNYDEALAKYAIKEKSKEEGKENLIVS